MIAVSDRDSMFDPGPSYYMEKIAVGPDAVGSIDITATPTQNLRWIAKAKRRDRCATSPSSSSTGPATPS